MIDTNDTTEFYIYCYSMLCIFFIEYLQLVFGRTTDMYNN